MALNENREPMRGRALDAGVHIQKEEMFRFTCRGVEIYEDITGNDEGRSVYLCKRSHA